MTDKELNTGDSVAHACQILEADFETNILRIKMLGENYKVSAGIKYLTNQQAYSQDYVNQLLWEIEALKKSLTESQQESFNWEDRYRSLT